MSTEQAVSLNLPENNRFVDRYPFAVSVGIMLVLFWLSHFFPSRTYPYGGKATITLGFIFAACSLFALVLGLKAKTAFWKNMFGLCAGVFWWVVYGEVGETLPDQGFSTSVQIGYGNLPFLLFLGVVFAAALYKKALTDDTLLQWANLFYVNWLGHVLLLTIFYSPLFGGPTPELGTGIRAWDVWSTQRITACLIVWGIYAVVLIPLILLKLRKSQDIRLKVASGFWFVIIAWSLIIEIPKKLFIFTAY